MKNVFLDGIILRQIHYIVCYFLWKWSSEVIFRWLYISVVSWLMPENIERFGYIFKLIFNVWKNLKKCDRQSVSQRPIHFGHAYKLFKDCLANFRKLKVIQKQFFILFWIVKISIKVLLISNLFFIKLRLVISVLYSFAFFFFYCSLFYLDGMMHLHFAAISIYMHIEKYHTLKE